MSLGAEKLDFIANNYATAKMRNVLNCTVHSEFFKFYNIKCNSGLLKYLV